MSRDYNIVTFHRAYNYGAVLQTYALQEFLKQLGYSAGVYDYISCGENKPAGKKERLIQFLLTFNKADIKRREEKYKAFAENMLDLNLEQDNRAYVSGSDQVWNPCGNMEDAYFLRFAPKEAKKVSYAASMGDGQVPEDKKQRWQSYISDFDHISVREESLGEKIKEFCNKEIVQNIDPTLLQDASFWSGVGKEVKGLPEKYILVYLMHLPKNVNKLLKWLQKQTKAKIVVVDGQGAVQGLFTNLVRHDMALHDMGPSEFVWLVQHAQSVVTSSFHGTAFSLIFNKEFYSINSKPNSRISSILNKCNINPVKEEAETFSRRDNIDWAFVNDVMKNERKKSEEYFNKIQLD